MVPRGVEQKPIAEETHPLLVEPTGTPNTGEEGTTASRKDL